MGGKRSDQYNIDPAEGSSTNHNWRGEGRSADEHIEDEQKQHLQANPHEQPMIPKPGTNPAARELADRKADGRSQKARMTADDQQADGDQSDDDRIDEASRESFPASDPPAQP